MRKRTSQGNEGFRSSSLHGGIVTFSLSGNLRIVSASKAWYITVGYSAQEALLDPFCNQLRRLVFPDDLDRFDEELQEVFAGMRSCLRYQIQKRDGSHAWQLAYVIAIEQSDEVPSCKALLLDITADINEKPFTPGLNQETNKSMDDSIGMLDVMVVEYGFKSHSVAAPSQAASLGLGKNGVVLVSLDDFETRGVLYPDSLEEYLTFSRSMESEPEGGIDLQYRIAEDTYHWVHLDTYAIDEQEGCPARHVGFVRFIDDPSARLMQPSASNEVADQQAQPDVQNDHPSPNKSQGASRRIPQHFQKTLLALSILFCVLGVTLAGVFVLYSHTLSQEFYQISIEGMNDYTAAQKVEMESSMNQIENTMAAMAVLAESPDVDPAGAVFSKYLADWNAQQAFPVEYVDIAQFEATVTGSSALPSDQVMLARVKSNESVISEVRYSERLGGYYYGIVEPIFTDGAIVGVLRSLIDAPYLLDTCQSSSQVSLIKAFLVKTDGVVVPLSEEEPRLDGLFYDALSQAGLPDEVARSAREAVESDDAVSTVMLGEKNGHMFFLTAIRLAFNDWNIVNITEENMLAEHSEVILRNTTLTGFVLLGVGGCAALFVFIFFNRVLKRMSYEADRYDVLSEFTDTVLFEYSYKTDTLTLTPNALKLFPVETLHKEHYLEENASSLKVHPSDYHLVKGLFENPGPPDELRSIVCRIPVLSGEYRWFSCQCRYLYRESTLYAAVGKMVDIDTQKTYEKRLIEQAQLDGLTKLYNKSSVESKIKELLSQENDGFLFVMDVNDFKYINDEYGHQVGDSVLARFGEVLAAVFRPNDPVGRIGGDEFVAYMPAINNRVLAEERALLVSQRMDQAAQDLGIAVSISFGIAQFPADGADYAALFEAADGLMYEAKRQVKKKTRL